MDKLYFKGESGQKRLNELIGKNGEKIDVVWNETDISNPCKYYMTLEEIGKELKVSGERVRSIEQKALSKLRHPKRSNILKAFIS